MQIKTRILWTLLGMSLLVALIGALAVNRQQVAATVGATKEAENVARVLGFLLSDSNSFSASAQEIVTKLKKVERRDVVLMDTNHLILADAVASNIGKLYEEDSGNEVGDTLKDRRARIFVETSYDYPLPIKQIVVPAQDHAGHVIGAVVLEYTPLYDELMQSTAHTTHQVIAMSLVSVIIALCIALYMGRSIAVPLRQLTNVAAGFASGKTDLKMPPPRKDEIGELADAFSNMVQKRQQAEEGLLQARDELEIRVTERTTELAKGNETLRIENAERKRAEQELRWKTAFLEAQVNSSIDGIVVVDAQGKKILHNQKVINLFCIPQHIVDMDDEQELLWVTDKTKNPEQFTEKVVHLSAHPNEISRDELELKDGTTLDRYSSPVVGKDGKYYGRIWTFRDITERKRTEESLHLLRSAVEQSKDAVVITDAELNLPGPKILFVNPAFTTMTGYTKDEALGRTPRILQGPRTDKAVLRRLREVLGRGEAFEGEVINYRKDGKEFDLEWTIAPIRNGSGSITHFVALQRDITERKRLEAKFFQSQKMETVGKLAGGIAHEFNSILTAIIGQSELLLADLPAGSPLTENATEISKAAGRAATLTRQLLAYGRKQFLQPETLDLNQVIVSMEGMFHHLMGNDVETQFVLAPSLHTVKVDAGQIEQVIINIVINARESMPNGGKLMVETANVSFDLESVDRYPELKPGDYAMLAITDTGAGMSAEVKAHVFEPFFSTKDVGQGTGLGLSTCYGIIKQGGGHISVYSELARGATFKVYLPQVEQQTKLLIQRLDSPDLPRGSETILLVEDDSALRGMAATVLRRLGYTVLEAANGVEALNLKHQRNIGHIDLLFTDVVMPHMSGKELADRVRALSPHIRILFTSAYTENAIVHQGVLDQGVALLPKPFTPSTLARKLREVLDQAAAPKQDTKHQTVGFSRILDEAEPSKK